MSVKPTDLARWADTGGAIVVPPSGKQDVGWVPGERPPAQFLNWLNNLAYQWHAYIDQQATQINLLSAQILGGWVRGLEYCLNSVINGTQREITYGPTIFFNQTTTNGVLYNSATGAPYYKVGTSPGSVSACIPLPVGSIVSGVTVWNKRVSGVIPIGAYNHNVGADSSVQLGDVASVSSGSTLVGTAIANFPPTTFTTGHELVVQVDCGAVNNQLHGVTVTYVSPSLENTALSNTAIITIPILSQATISALNLRIFGTATSDLAVWLGKVAANETKVALVDAVSLNIGAAWKTETFTFARDTFDVGDTLILYLTANEAGVKVENAWLVA